MNDGIVDLTDDSSVVRGAQATQTRSIEQLFVPVAKLRPATSTSHTTASTYGLNGAAGARSPRGGGGGGSGSGNIAQTLSPSHTARLRDSAAFPENVVPASHALRGGVLD